MLLNEFSRKYWLLFGLSIFIFSSRQMFGQMAVEVEKTNVVYLGMQNPITVVVSDIPNSCLLLEPSHGTIQKEEYYGEETIETGKYEWSFNNVDTNVVTLKVIDSCTHEQIAERNYRVFEMPATMRFGARFKSQTIKLGIFKAQGGVAALVDCCDIDAKYDMVGFSVQIYSIASGEVWSGYNQGARFAGQVATRCQAVRAGDWVRFYGFSYLYPGQKRPRHSEEELVFKIE